jgi:very-short-patch-repair endonuclease
MGLTVSASCFTRVSLGCALGTGCFGDRRLGAVPHRDTKVGRIANRQFGVFSGPQAVAAGYPRTTIQYRVERGTWLRIIGDTYRSTTTAKVWQQPLVAAYLAVGQPSAFGGEAAWALWGLTERCTEPEVVVPWCRRPRSKAFRVRRTRRYTPRDMLLMGGFHVTSIGRTLLDLAPRLPGDRLESALDAAHRKGLDLSAYDSYLDAAVSAKILGARKLLDLVLLRDPSRPIESEAETLLFRVLRNSRLPLPVPQFWIALRSGRRRLDLAYPDYKVAIEVDSYRHHGSRAAFESDRARDNELAEIGWKCRRITWDMLTTRPEEVQWTVGRSLGLVPAAWRRH